MAESLQAYVESTTFDAARIAALTGEIHAAVLSGLKYLDGPNFLKIHPSALEQLLAEYDARFFGDRIRAALGTTPLRFRLSQRMTSAGGTTVAFKNQKTGAMRYEITASVAILFECFRGDDHRPIVASGIVCRDRLDALQRVMEHELTHLIEMLCWDKSSCTQARFQSIAERFFGHTVHTHQLITPRERAIVQSGLKPGMKVRFTFEGVERTGIINGITKRATVLVEDPKGAMYSSGKRYLKFYVPVRALTRVE